MGLLIGGQRGEYFRNEAQRLQTANDDAPHRAGFRDRHILEEKFPPG